MLELLIVAVRAVTLVRRGDRELVLENLALRQQLAAYRAVRRDIQEFRARGLVIDAQGAVDEEGCRPRTRFSRVHVHSAEPISPAVTSRRPARGSQTSAPGDYAAASLDGHVPHAADRFASMRTRRAAAARAVRSAGTASPVP